MDLDLIVRNGTIVTACEILRPGLDIGVKGGKIVCIGVSLPASDRTQIIDAEGAYVTPGGVDSHVHLAETDDPAGDSWESGSRSAIAGGTTTIIAFAPQTKDDSSLFPVLEQYDKRVQGQSHADYGYHIILTYPTKYILQNELPVIAADHGVTSVKLYMTYEEYMLSDRQVLEVLFACRRLGMTTMIHAESHDMISLIIDGLEKNDNTAPYFHTIARPRIAEDEAAYRAISMAELADAPILIVHMSSEISVGHVREAQGRLLPIHAETCPQYLFLLSEKLKPEPHDHFAGAKHVCSPPLRHAPEDLESLWRFVANGTITTWSSDHCPSSYHHPKGKQLGLVNGIPRFTDIPNGLPGIETRVPLLFSKTPACLPPDQAKLSLPCFVQLTSSNPARLYGLGACKGSAAPGYDADLVIWHPGNSGARHINQSMLHHDIDYTPFEGVYVGNWPRYTILRGKIVWDASKGIVGRPGDGQYLKRGKGEILNGKTGNLPRGMVEDERKFWL